MKASDIIEAVTELKALEAEEIEAEKRAVKRRHRIAMLNGFLDRLASGVRTKAEAEVAAAPTRKRESPRQDQVRALLNSKPDADYRDIVKALYGEYTKASVLNARSLISNMKREGQIIGEPGAWRVVDSEQAKGPTVEVPPVPMSPFAQAS